MSDKVRYNQLRDQIMTATACSKRTAQLAIAEACQHGWIAQARYEVWAGSEGIG